MSTVFNTSISMKGNFPLKVTIFLLFLFFCGIKPTWGQENDCGNKIEITKTVPATDDNSGGLEVYVETDYAFDCHLYKVSGEGKVLQEAKTRESSGTISFDGLKKGNYKILVEFSGVEDPFCQFVQVAGISITKQ